MPDSPSSHEVALLRMWAEGRFNVQDKTLESLRIDLSKLSSITDHELAKKVNIEEFKPIRMMAYSTASTILLAVIMAVVNTVIVGSSN